MSLRWVLGLASLALSGCFAEANPLSPQCRAGTEACPCDGERCDDGLTCHENVCRRPDCREGTELCPCFEGNCFSGLQCVDDTCRPISGDTTGPGNTSNPVESTSAVEPSETTNSSSPQDTTSTTTPSESTSETTSAEDSSTSPGDTSADETSIADVDTSPQVCSCQASVSDYQSCFFGDTGFPAVYCSAIPELGSTCDSVEPPITVPGCCADDFTVLYCDIDNIVRSMDCFDDAFCL